MEALQTIDTYLSISLKVILRLFYKLSIILLGIFGFVLSINDIFEYGNILADLSNIEIIFLLVLLGLFERHYKYCKLLRTGFWRMLASPFLSLGILFLFYIFIIGFGSIISECNVSFQHCSVSKVEKTSIDLFLQPNLIQSSNFILMLISIYLSTPLLIKKQQVKVDL